MSTDTIPSSSEPDPESRENTAKVSARRDKLLKRLKPYWMMEGANVVFVPFFAWFLITVVSKGQISIAVIAAMLATSVLLVDGTFAWKMVVDGLEGNPKSEEQWTPWLDLARCPARAFAVRISPSPFAPSVKELEKFRKVRFGVDSSTVVRVSWLKYKCTGSVVC